MTSAETFILNLGGRLVHDVWASHLQDHNLVLGANSKAIYIKDIDATRSLQVLDTQSDVFAVHQHDTLIYTGSRNGSIARFDMRTDKSRGLQLFDSRFLSGAASAVTYMNIIRDSQMVVSHMNGCVGLSHVIYRGLQTDAVSIACDI
jgi:WD repeat-containing protein 21A